VLGKAPDPLPDAGAAIDVFIKDDVPQAPQYTWDDPRAGKKPPSSGTHEGRPGPRRR
jgi:hypothetical protein